MAIKRRTFDLLGIFPYEESFADGIQVRCSWVVYTVCYLFRCSCVNHSISGMLISLYFCILELCCVLMILGNVVLTKCTPEQVLRYNTTTGYATHMDWIEPKKGPNGEQEHDYDSAADGTNRFATILLYLRYPCDLFVWCVCDRRAHFIECLCLSFNVNKSHTQWHGGGWRDSFPLFGPPLSEDQHV